MAMEIDQATKHGVNVFIFDWYWYDGRPFMETTLDNGFLKAGNVDKMQFYLMWANHEAVNTWDTRLARVNEHNVIWTGKVDRQEFEKICRRNIEKYFKHPQYYKIDGKPVFMIYDIPQLISGLGGIEETVDALEWFKEETVKAGFPGLELQITMWSINMNYSGFDAGKSGRPENDFVKKRRGERVAAYRPDIRLPVLSAYQCRLGQQPAYRPQCRGEEQHSGEFREGPAQSQGLRRQPSGPGTSDHHQQLERMDRDELPAAMQCVRLRVPRSCETGVRG